jgi:hypothetical protein
MHRSCDERDDRLDRRFDEHVAVEDEKRRRLEVVKCIADAAGRSKQMVLHHADDFSRSLVGLEERADLFRVMVGIDNDPADAVPLEVTEVPLEERLTVHVDQDLGYDLAELPEASSAPRSEDHAVHR